jgi:(2Fe-2S) ferredoxin/SAM-dependent methyltransferase
MEPFRYHVFVCMQDKPEGVASCCRSGSLEVLRRMEHELARQGLDDEVQVTTCGCLGLCDDGPIMITYPDGTWYHKLRGEDVPEIVSSHFASGSPVMRLTWHDADAMKKQATEHRERYRAMVKARDEAGILPDDLNDIVRAFMPSRALLTALELGVFTVIADGASAASVARSMQTDARATEMLLNALVSLDLLEKKDGQFFNTPRARRFFTEGSSDNATPALMHTAHLWHRWSTLTQCVRIGTSVRSQDHEESGRKVFIAAMDRNAKERTSAVIRAVGCDGINRMLDLGGGSGAYSIAFARAIPGLRSEILDMSGVLPLTKEYIRQAGLTDRIAIRSGDMLRDRLGKDYDLVLASAVCHMFSPDENRALFQRVYEVLAPGGRLVVQDFVLDASKTSPRAAALFSLNMLVGTAAGSSYSEPEYADWMQRAGFQNVQRMRLPGPVSLMIGVRA